MKIFPVIMSGGSGTRLWPLSRKQNPKQYHALVTENTLFEETVNRVKAKVDGADIQAPIIICADGHQDKILSQCEKIDIKPLAVLLEPMGRNTAAVAVVASQYVKEIDPDGLILLMPADHHIDDVDGFWQCVMRGTQAASGPHLVTLGIHPQRPETGFGYIKRGEEISDHGVYHVDKFVEKPDRETAQHYINEGDYSWNAGIFLFGAASMLHEFNLHAADILDVSQKALAESKKYDDARSDVRCLCPQTFEKCRDESIDYAVMEPTEHAAIVTPVNVGWNDIGAWPAVRDASLMMQNRNNGEEIDVMEMGDVTAINCENSYIRTEGIKVAAVGVKDMIIVATEDAVLVMPASEAQDVKKVINSLKDKERKNLL